MNNEYPVDFSNLLGNEQVKKHLAAAIQKKAVGHAFLFAGPEGIGKSLFARAFAAQLMASYDGNHLFPQMRAGSHPDLHILRPEGKMGLHSIQAMREFAEEVYLPAYSASWKVFIIHDAERMYSYSANALLKTFEEPPPRTLIILLTHSRALLLPTILSRCQTLSFHPLPEDSIKEYLIEKKSLDPKLADLLAKRAEGSLGNALRGAEQQNDTACSLLLQLLASGHFVSYRQLQKSIQEIVEKVSLIKAQVEEAIKEDLSALMSDQLTALQKEAFDKETEGRGALVQLEESQALLKSFISWYRDLELLSLGGSQELLINAAYQAELESELKLRKPLPLQTIFKVVSEAEKAMQRSTSLAVCLDTLFLKTRASY